ncbi:MAG: hypothetical protein OFPII_11830 [Osedax symbiont Rs1]|nr:MAG: hypothetical protein OFPII_11830 [Osedax symbiont Rs1]
MGRNFYVQDVRSVFCSRQILSTDIPVGNGKEPLWFGFFFAYMDVGKGREQDAEAFRKKK